jgi:hypothetical protein
MRVRWWGSAKDVILWDLQANERKEEVAEVKDTETLDSSDGGGLSRLCRASIFEYTVELNYCQGIVLNL